MTGVAGEATGAFRTGAGSRALARPDGRDGSSLRELLAFVLAFARSYG